MRQSRGESRSGAQGHKGIKRLLDDKGDNFYNNINNFFQQHLRMQQHSTRSRYTIGVAKATPINFMLDDLDRLVVLEDSVEFVESGEGLPTELLGSSAVDKDIVHEMKHPFAAFLFE